MIKKELQKYNSIFNKILFFIELLAYLLAILLIPFSFFGINFYIYGYIHNSFYNMIPQELSLIFSAFKVIISIIPSGIITCVVSVYPLFYLDSYLNRKKSISNKKNELLENINSLKYKLKLEEKHYESLYNQIDLVLKNNQEVILEELPEYKKLFDKKLEIQNQKIKDLYNKQQEIVKQKIELSDFLVENIDDFEEKIISLKKKITIVKQNLIINKEE